MLYTSLKIHNNFMKQSDRRFKNMSQRDTEVKKEG